jgi:iron only hydrogenase large subunit-like protein
LGALVEKTKSKRFGMPSMIQPNIVVVQTAPAVRVAIGEELGYDPGERLTGKW